MTGFAPLTDTATPSALRAATGWIQAALLGSMASIVAVMAIAAVGLLLMQGQIPLRRGLVTVLGCFVLFGAHVIAKGILDMPAAFGSGTPPLASPPPPSPLPITRPEPSVYDPYAGASVPVTH